MIIFHPGDNVVLVSENQPEFNGNIATFVSYYPAIMRDEELSELHAAVITANWIPGLGNRPGTMRLAPDTLVKVNIDTIPNDITFHQDQVDKRVKDDIEIILKNRLSAGVHVVDQMINRAVDKYLSDMEENYPEMKDEFWKRCKESILQQGKLYEGDTTFREHLRYALQNLADKYIKEHEDELKELMKDSIEAAASHLMQEELAKKIGTNMYEYIRSLF